MALDGSSSGAFDIMSPADEYLNFFISEAPDMHEIFPYTRAYPIGLNWYDLEKRKVTMRICGDWVYENYKRVKATIIVTPKEHSNGSCLAWTVKFKKILHETRPPERIFEYLVSYFKTIDHYCDLRAGLNGKVDSIDIESPANECFKAFIEAFKTDANVEIEAGDWENRTSTMRMRSTHIFMNDYKTFKVTITITPIEPSDDGTNVAYTIPGHSNMAYTRDRSRSHVAWTMECEQIDYTINPKLSINTACYLRHMYAMLLK